MNEWEAKYKALLAGIKNREYVTNAELLVSKAIDISASSHVSFEDTLQAMLQVIGIFRANQQIPHGVDLLNVWPIKDE